MKTRNPRRAVDVDELEAAAAGAQPTGGNIKDGHVIFVINPQPVYGVA